MKKIILSIITLLAISLPACSQNKTVQDKTADTTEQVKAEVIQMNAAMFREKVFDYTNKEYKFKGQRPVIIDFNAKWCGPCRQLTPIFEKLANEYAGKVDFYSVDIDKERELASAFGVSSIPALLFIPMEGEPKGSLGLIPEENLRQSIDSILIKK